jgi:hypothetical protein
MQLLSGTFRSGDTVVADADPATRTLRFEKMPAAEPQPSAA